MTNVHYWWMMQVGAMNVAPQQKIITTLLVDDAREQ
jgi:hypothetical protein